jgi:hypothetical protein
LENLLIYSVEIKKVLLNMFFNLPIKEFTILKEINDLFEIFINQKYLVFSIS